MLATGREEKHGIYFVKSTGGKMVATGFFTSVSQGQKHLKHQGTSKLNANCPASWIVTKHQSSIISVDSVLPIMATLSLGHVRLSHSTRSDTENYLKVLRLRGF